MTKNICIYHGNCADGFGAAMAVYTKAKLDNELDKWEFFAGHYGGELPNVKDKLVVLVDFSYKKDVLLELSKDAWGILIIDHHKTAQEDLKDFPTYQKGMTVEGGIYTIFDMNKSGAMLAWEFFHNHKDIPQLIHHIQDRDLWLFKLPQTREIQAALFSYDYDFEVWESLLKIDPVILAKEGLTLERKHFKDMHELLKQTMRVMTINGHKIWAANLPYTLSFDAGNYMCKQPLPSGELPAFAACYMDTPEGRTFSLRSVETGIDVSEIAKQFGGGGHKQAAGFKIDQPLIFHFNSKRTGE